MTHALSRPALIPLALALAGATLSARTPMAQNLPANPATGTQAWVQLVAEGRAELRAWTTQAQCPVAEVDGQSLAMRLRAPAGVAANRHEGKLPAPVFPVNSCELTLPEGVKTLRVEGQALPLPKLQYQRIVVLGDTGCRLKGAEVQDCLDPKAWPLADISRQIAAWGPDLVLHMGDYHYRESACPEGRAGCAGSPFGYGWEAWQADFFQPAAPLLRAAPWVMVRGNHESCMRAGQGWHRLMGAAAYDPAANCDQASGDAQADFGEPFAVPIDSQHQFIVFDSARASYTTLQPGDALHVPFLRAVEAVKRLSLQRPASFFTSHHPVLGFATNQLGGGIPGTPSLTSVMGQAVGPRYFPEGVRLALHGHVHTFQALRFASDHPSTLISGHGASGLSTPLALPLPAGLQPAPGADVAEAHSLDGFGFVTLERLAGEWRIEEHSLAGHKRLSCTLAVDSPKAGLRCEAVKP